jgi:Mg2+ and Co2+ transporter CorA
MIRTIYRNSKGSFTTDVPESHWKVALHDAGGLFWVDIAGEPPERVRHLMSETFGFHPLAIDNALEAATTPKLDDWGEYIYAAVHCISFDAATHDYKRDRRIPEQELSADAPQEPNGLCRLRLEDVAAQRALPGAWG